MKRITILVLAIVALSSAQAQFGDYGIRLGIGSATINDDLSTQAPVLGLNVGGYINFTLPNNPTVLSEIFYIQSGINLIRRGANFQEHFENENTLCIRTGYYHSYYLQVPLLAAVHFELPIRQAGHVVGVFIGPAVSYGLFGRYADRKVSPGMSTSIDNYDVHFNGTPEDRKLFNHINRLDVSAILGITYERGPFTFSLFLDHGFLATSEGTDILRIIDNQTSFDESSNVNVTIPDGNNHTVMLGVSYRLGSLNK